MLWFTKKNGTNDTDKVIRLVMNHGKVAAVTNTEYKGEKVRGLTFSLFDNLYSLYIDANNQPVRIVTVISVKLLQSGYCELVATDGENWSVLNTWKPEDITKATFREFGNWVNTFIESAPKKGIILRGEHNVRIFTE